VNRPARERFRDWSLFRYALIDELAILMTTGAWVADPASPGLDPGFAGRAGASPAKPKAKTEPDEAAHG